MAGFNVQEAREFQRRKMQLEADAVRERLHRARHDFDRIVKMLITKYNPKRIYQWGSLVHHENFSLLSDIDIAVEGVRSAEEFFSMYGDAIAATPFSLDMVEMEHIDPLHQASIKKRGRLIYERE